MIKSLFIFSFLLVTVLFEMATGQDRSQTRSMVMSRGGIAATESPLASQTAAMILARGGNAVDAAIAANAVMGFVAPVGNGIGGDLFAIVYNAKTDSLYGLNASGWSPKGLTPGFLSSKGITSMPQLGIHSVTVPGVVDGWEKLLHRFGTMGFSEVLAPAIQYAREGVPVTELVAAAWKGSEKFLMGDDTSQNFQHAKKNVGDDTNAAHTYLPNGRAPRRGEIFRNPELARSLEQIARRGRDGFYKGDIAERIVNTSDRFGGTMTTSDLAGYSSEWVDPISTTYHGWTVYEIPPNGQGIAALMMLNIMETFPLSSYGQNSAQSLHAMIEAKKLAYADMLHYIGDPKSSKIPVKELLSKRYAAERATLIDKTKANPHVDAGTPPTPGDDTIYLTVVDKEGNMVSLIQSNYSGFGSGVVPDAAGFMLQNRGALFTLDEASPNVLAGHKRPLHTIIPAFMRRGDTTIAFGIMGGWNQSQAHAQFVSNIVDHRMNIQAAIEAPRFTKLTFEGNDVDMESRIPEKVRKELTALGHEIKLRGEYSGAVGGGQSVMRIRSLGVNFGASDPRKDGAAIPEPLFK